LKVIYNIFNVSKEINEFFVDGDGESHFFEVRKQHIANKRKM